MYWCRFKSLYLAAICAFLFIALLPACKPDTTQNGTAVKYFDLQGYFKADAARLNKLKRPVFKTVTHNKISESKKVIINNWELELSLFIESDINKPAWKDRYLVQDAGNIVIYRAKDPDLKTQEIIINKPGNKIKWIYIYNSIKDTLYHTTLYQTSERLSYFPDSIYIIKKYQKVRLLGANYYTIEGTLN